MAKKKIRTNDNLTPRKDGRVWLRQNLANTQYNRDEKGSAEAVHFSLYDADSFCGLLTDVMARLETVRDFYEKEGFRSIKVSLESDYDGGTDVAVHGYKLETKEALATRLRRNANSRVAAKKRTKAAKERKEQRDKSEFERLKKKFEKGKG